MEILQILWQASIKFPVFKKEKGIQYFEEKREWDEEQEKKQSGIIN